MKELKYQLRMLFAEKLFGLILKIVPKEKEGIEIVAVIGKYFIDAVKRRKPPTCPTHKIALRYAGNEEEGEKYECRVCDYQTIKKH